MSLEQLGDSCSGSRSRRKNISPRNGVESEDMKIFLIVDCLKLS